MLNLVPYPVSCKRIAGNFTIPARTMVRVSESISVRPDIIHKFKTLDLRWKVDPALPDNTIMIGSPCMHELQPPGRPEGYTLRVDRNGCVIVGADADGLFWGLVTLEQLLANGRECRCVLITDYPAFSFRMHHDDISRKQVSTLDDFKRIIRHLSNFKIRYYTLYMEDMLYLKHFPDIGKDRGRLTPAEVRGMLKEAEKYNVTIFPTFSLIGHQENLLSNPAYRKYAREVFQEPSSFDVSKPGLRPFLRKVIRDVCELFPDAPFFHAGFDEVIGLNREEFIAHANWCAREIAKHGKKMMMWVDMLKNHWGLELLHELDGNILPVEWNYDDPGKYESAYVKVGVVPYGLAGYGSTHTFLPDFRKGKANMDSWAGVMKRWGGPGYGVSQWGDDGYENSRDLCWNLFAYNAETAWRGGPAANDFESRFQAVFYGLPLADMRRMLGGYAVGRSIAPNRIWELFRGGVGQMVRTLAVEPDLAQRAARELKRVRTAINQVRKAQAEAKREAGHIDHFICALERERNVFERILLARDIRRGLRGQALVRASRHHQTLLRHLRAFYERTWLKQFKRQNIEVSLRVFDRLRKSVGDLRRQPSRSGLRYHMLDLEPVYNTCVPEVGDLPLVPVHFDGIPFRFASYDKTHLTLPAGECVQIPFRATRLHDLHLICAGRTIDKERKQGNFVVEVELLYEGRSVFREKLEAIRHVCDWWAPLGEHMWAGGGMKYVDSRRVDYAFSPGHHYGLARLHGFMIRGVDADALVLRRIAEDDFYLFAATVKGLFIV